MYATMDGFITDFTITPANIDDSDGVCNLVYSYWQITSIGDKGYIGAKFAVDLK